VRTTVTASSDAASAVQNPLNRQIDFVANGATSNLDAICEGAQRPMGPTASAILWDMLVERFCRIGDAIDVLPRKVGGQIFLANVRVRQRGGVVILNLVAFEDLRAND
jgi:hypothetical protein